MKKYEALKTEYLCWLMNHAQIEAEGSSGYLQLCRQLQETEFFPILEMDENRCCDCRRLRQDFAKDNESFLDEGTGDILDGLYGENGTMMELLLILAEKMSYDLADSEYEAGVGKWFEEMLENLGLTAATNEAFDEDEEGVSEMVADILDRVIFRKIGWDGEDGLFPLRWPKNDQRYAELVEQMNAYIEENYDIC